MAELVERRLVTLTGTGGVGKTRLAIEIVWLMVDEFPGGERWWWSWRLVAEPASVVAAVASTLSVQAQHGMNTVEAIVDWLRGRRLLLVVDNCEHVLVPVGELVEAVVAGCPTVTVLATSREPLGLPGERVHLRGGLDPAFEGVELLCDRAVAADGSFAPTGHRPGGDHRGLPAPRRDPARHRVGRGSWSVCSPRPICLHMSTNASGCCGGPDGSGWNVIGRCERCTWL